MKAILKEINLNQAFFKSVTVIQDHFERYNKENQDGQKLQKAKFIKPEVVTRLV